MIVSDMAANSLCFFVNGQEILETNPDPEWTLLYYLRRKLKLTGTKYGCGHGKCGSCTVMVSRLERDGSIKHLSVNACLTPVVALHDSAVTTVEGVGSIKTKLHPVQERLAFAHGSQCGFCTPGVIMSMYSLLRMTPVPTMSEIEDNLVGNLCRCTGYRPIVDGFRSFSAEFISCGAKNCCQKGSKECSRIANITLPPVSKDDSEDKLTNELIFPPKLLIKSVEEFKCVVFRGPRVTWYIPTTLKELLEIKNVFSDAKIVAGNTIIGIGGQYKRSPDAVQIYAIKVPELNQFDVLKNGIKIGAAMGLSDVERNITKVINSLPEFKTRVIRGLAEMLKWFANKQIKNVASIGGNIKAASAVSSITQVLLGCEAEIHIKSCDSERFIVMDRNFYAKDKNISVIKTNEIIISVFIPFTKENEFFEVYRQARSRANDSSIVNAGMKVVFEKNSNKVADLKLAFGAVAKTTVLATKTMMSLQGLHWNDKLLEKSSGLLFEDLSFDITSPGGSIHYRRTLVLSFFLKFYLKVCNQLSLLLGDKRTLPSDEISAIRSCENIPMKSSQILNQKRDEEMYPIGKPMIHSSGIKHVTGQAIYIDDMPLFEDELFGALVISQKAKATIENIEFEEALKVNGAVKFFCHRDIEPEQNMVGAFVKDEELFASKEVSAVGQIIGLIVAKTEKAALEASKKVIITYRESKPVVTIEDAIKEGDDYETFEVQNGNIEKGFSEADHILEGEVRLACQEHFYMETQAGIAVPKEDGDMDIYLATQDQVLAQNFSSMALGVPANRVHIRTKRVGGSFGGKISFAAKIATIIAVAASKVGKPVRLILNREVDIMATGKRHSFLAFWKVGYKNNGEILAVDTHSYLNAGNFCDDSIEIAKCSILFSDNVYSIPNFRANTKPCKTNTPSNTAFRGFGIPQSTFVMEDIMTRVAGALNISQKKIREINMYPVENPRTFYGQSLQNCSIRKCWDEILQKSDYQKRLLSVNKFNRENKFRKRGIAITPHKQPVSFGIKSMSQAEALVHIYLDGSILLSHGAIEMGQGVHVKLIQIASKELGIPADKIYTAENATDKIANATLTAASTGADFNGMAVMNACKILMEGISPYKEKNPDGDWISWINAAYCNQVQLSAIGHYKDEYCFGYDFKSGNGHEAFTYFTYGSAVTEVEIDVLTGDHCVLRVDIVADAGKSLNSAVDIGQIEGGFLQGYGLFVLEELVYNSKGEIRLKGPYTYKIPTINDISREFNVHLLKDSHNPRTAYSSKGLGEEPLTLGISVYSAIKMAIMAARNDNIPFRLDAPATSERIRMACNDKLVVQAKPEVKDEYEV